MLALRFYFIALSLFGFPYVPFYFSSCKAFSTVDTQRFSYFSFYLQQVLRGVVERLMALFFYSNHTKSF